MLSALFADTRYAGRRLRARLVYTSMAVLTLGLGIGGTAAAWGIARPLLFEPLPYAAEHEIGAFWMPFDWTEEEFLFLRGRVPGFRAVAAYRAGDTTFREGELPARLLPGIASSVELFDVLGVQPMLGRGFQEEDGFPGAEPVVVLSNGLWRELGGQPSIVGQSLMLDGIPRTVVGVMPRGFWFPSPDVRVWMPVALSPEQQVGRYALVGRVASEQRLEAMETPLDQLATTLGERFEYPAQWDKTRNPTITPVREYLVGSMRAPLLATLAAMGLVLLIACANVTALMLGQVEGRTSELAVRSALGANNVRLIQQVVVEALLIGLAAALAGAAFAAIAFRSLARTLPLGSWGEGAALDWGVFGVALGIALTAALLVVLAPSAALRRGGPRDALSGHRTGGIRGRGGRIERGLVVAEVTLTMLIVSGTALLVRSVANLYAIHPGFSIEGVAVLDVVIPADLPNARRARTLAELTSALGELPGVEMVGATHKLPLRGPGSSTSMAVRGREDQAETTTSFRLVTPGYFEAMGIPLRDGRVFTQADLASEGGAQVVVINEALAREYFDGEDPIGQYVASGFGGWAEVVGIVGDVAEEALTDDHHPARYSLFSRAPYFPEAQTLVIRTGGQEAAAILDAARRTVQQISPGVPVRGSTTAARVLDIAVGPARQLMSLLGMLSALALVLGAVGIYGVISHFATSRQRDWAIRVALGLPGSRVVTTIVGQGAALVCAGIVLAAMGALVTARLLGSFLFGVSFLDIPALAAASITVLSIGTVAALFPAWRAGAVDPALTLRKP